MSNTFTITGRLAADIELRFSGQGKAVANGRVLDTPRRLNQQTNQWEDAGETLGLNFSIWDRKAEALANTAHKGDLVIVTGELVARSWEKDGEKRTVNEIKAREVAVVPRAEKHQTDTGTWGQQPTQAAQPASAWNQDPGTGGWGQQPNLDSPPF